MSDQVTDPVIPVSEPPTNGESRADGWTSLMTGFGDPSRDKRESLYFQPRTLTKHHVAHLWRSNDLAARIIEEMPKEIFRQGYEFNTGDDKELAKDMITLGEELGVTNAFKKARCYQRAYGGGAIFPVMQDQQGDLSKPLQMERVVQVEALHVFDPEELRPAQFYTSIRDKKFGMPSTYILYPRMRGGNPADISSGVEIHESRLIVFEGIRVSRDQISADQWGDSIMCRCYEVLRDYGVSWSAAAVLLQDFGFPKFKMKGLATLFAQNKDQVVKNRMRAIEISRSAVNAILMDADSEDYERTATSFAGYAEMMQQFALRLAAAANYPVTKLMGQSPAGMNATGESDTRFWYDQVACEQDETIPELERLYKIIFLSRNGPTNGREPDHWSVKFRPLWQSSDTEQSTTRKTHADTDKVYFDMGVLSAEDIRRSRFGGDKYGNEIVVDDDDIEADQDDIDAAMVDPSLTSVSSGGGQVIGQADVTQAVATILDIIERVIDGKLPRESGQKLISVAYGMSMEEADELLGPAEFEPTATESPIALPPAGEDESGEEEEEDQPKDPEKDQEEEEED